MYDSWCECWVTEPNFLFMAYAILISTVSVYCTVDCTQHLKFEVIVPRIGTSVLTLKLWMIHNFFITELMGNNCNVNIFCPVYMMVKSFVGLLHFAVPLLTCQRAFHLAALTDWREYAIPFVHFLHSWISNCWDILMAVAFLVLCQWNVSISKPSHTSMWYMDIVPPPQG